MNIAATRILLSALILVVFTAIGGQAQEQDLHFHWKSSPVIDDGGIVRPEAVNYEVWLKRGDGDEQLLATVADTTYWFSAQPGIKQQLRVRGVDQEGRKSVMSEWSDPIYFEVPGGNVVRTPMGAQLKANYPNPFNPETRIVYGVPEDIRSGDVVRLEIFTVQGYRVRTLPVDRSPGWHEVVWDGKDDRGMVASTGMYVTRFVVGKSVETRKMTMVK